MQTSEKMKIFLHLKNEWSVYLLSINSTVPHKIKVVWNEHVILKIRYIIIIKYFKWKKAFSILK